MVPSPETPIPRIRRLDPSVVKRIAAGEIIVQPANALKELLENAIDAGATMIDVLVKDGGLKLLQLTDNGCGIARDDMLLLCERFTTSKLRTFDDLALIATYGFRGEALASISHIARLSVVSKVPVANVAYKCFYVNGNLATPKFKADPECVPQPVAGNTGTQIVVEDLFYNLPSRLHALRSKNDEWIKVLDVLGRYAVHSGNVGFSCKKFGDPFPSISTRLLASLQERIRVVFGTAVASEVIEFSFDCNLQDNGENEVDEINPREAFGLCQVRGAVSGFNYNNKRKIQPVLFINNRLVACDPLKRAIYSVFQVFLPKGNQPFVYLSLDIVPQNVDVNVHPTKREVRFLYEDEILEWIFGKLHDVLSKKDSSRTFKQSVLKRGGEDQELDSITATTKKYRQENKLVRVDATQQKISAFLKPSQPGLLSLLEPFDPSLDPDVTLQSFESSQKSSKVEPPFEWRVESPESTFLDDLDEPVAVDDKVAESGLVPVPSTIVTHSGRSHQEVRLDSVAELRREVTLAMYRPLSNVFNHLIYVGIVDANKRLCCFQYDVKLFLCDYGAVLAEFYYQVVLAGFSNFGEYVLPDPVSLSDILRPLYETHKDLEPAETVIENILAMAEMFNEYFQLDFSGGSLCKLPMIIKDLEPSRHKLPYFVYRLGARVDYSCEKECFRGISKQIALLYVPDRIDCENLDKVSIAKEPQDSEPSTDLVEARALALQKRDALNAVLEHTVFPNLKRRFIATEPLAPSVIQVADLPGLYRVFERC